MAVVARLAVCLALASCDYALRLDHVAPGTGDASGLDPDVLDLRCTTDSFDAFTGMWSPFAAPSEATVAINGGRLEINLENAQSAHAGVVSVARNMTGYVTEIELVEPVGVAGSRSYIDWLNMADGEWYTIAVVANELEFGHSKSSVVQQVPFSANAHKFLRIDHDPTENTVRYLTAGDDRIWQLQRADPVTGASPIDQVQVRIGAGDCCGGMPTGRARFDNFAMCAPP